MIQKKQCFFGRMCGGLFKDTEHLLLDDISMHRSIETELNEYGSNREVKTYTFTQETAKTDANSVDFQAISGHPPNKPIKPINLLVCKKNQFCLVKDIGMGLVSLSGLEEGLQLPRLSLSALLSPHRESGGVWTIHLIRYGLVVDICADLRIIDLKDDNPCKVTLYVFGMAEAILKSATPGSDRVYIVAELIYLIALRGNVVAMVSTKRIVCIVILNSLPTG
jgi:hypothetical protein